MTDLSTPEPLAQTSAELDISGMTCASCAMRVEKALAKLPGVASVSVNLATEKATVNLSDSATGIDALVAAVTKAGYQATPIVEEAAPDAAPSVAQRAQQVTQIGRASCRERVYLAV